MQQETSNQSPRSTEVAGVNAIKKKGKKYDRYKPMKPNPNNYQDQLKYDCKKCGIRNKI